MHTPACLPQELSDLSAEGEPHFTTQSQVFIPLYSQGLPFLDKTSTVNSAGD